MKKWTLVLGSFFLILFFQNCQKSKVSESSNTDETVYNKTAANDFPTLQLGSHDQPKVYELDIATGRIQVYLNQGQNRDQDLCLTDGEKQEVQGILSAAEVCEPLPTGNSLNRVCTLEYKYPYATLIDGLKEVRLGERTQGCLQPIDLCGAKADLLKGFVSRVLPTIDQHACK